MTHTKEEKTERPEDIKYRVLRHVKSLLEDGTDFENIHWEGQVLSCINKDAYMDGRYSTEGFVEKTKNLVKALMADEINSVKLGVKEPEEWMKA